MQFLTPLEVDISTPTISPVVYLKQGDNTRGILVTLLFSGQIVYLTNETVNIYMKKPDGTKVYSPCEIESGKIKAVFDNQAVAVPGKAQIELEFVLGQQISSTPIAVADILPTNIDDNAIESSNEFTALQQALIEVNDLKQNGLKGDTGEAATIAVGTVTASAPGSSPQISNSGTPNNAVFDFVLPRGNPGSTGGFFGAKSSFPATGTEDMLYIDNTADPALAYVWDGSKYVLVGIPISVSDGVLTLGVS